jgi:hypothetical protein
MKTICKACQEEKEKELDFPKTVKKEGIYFSPTCKKCTLKKGRERARDRYVNDPDYKERKRKAINQAKKKYRAARNHSWKKEIEYNKKWKESNKEKVKKHVNTLYHKKYSNPSYKIHTNMKTLINSYIRLKRYDFFIKEIGYSIRDLMNYIEKLFEPGMSWDNRSSWHIDHIEPLCSFNTQKKGDEEFRKCWALSNLRPLWPRDNHLKGQKDRLLKKIFLTPNEKGLE